MNLDLDLITGDTVEWTIGAFHMIGCVLEDHGCGEVEIMTHTRSGAQHNQISFVDKKKLTLRF
tara:strand:+ start:263 stop:451 length:189 start_codon:yes stop_codon:yes gene_type:complete